MARVTVATRGGSAVVGTWQTEWVRVDQLEPASRFVGWEFHVQVVANQRLRLDWFQEFTYGLAADANPGVHPTGGTPRMLPAPTSQPIREQMEQAGASGAIDHFNITRTMRVPGPAPAVGPDLQRRYFPMLVQHRWVRLNVTGTMEAGGSDSLRVSVKAIVEGWPMNDGDPGF